MFNNFKKIQLAVTSETTFLFLLRYINKIQLKIYVIIVCIFNTECQFSLIYEFMTPLKCKKNV